MFSSTTPELLIDAGSEMPRVWIMASTAVSSEISFIAGFDEIPDAGIGFLAGLGEYSRGLTGVGLRLGDIVAHVSQATYASTKTTITYPGIVTLHSCIRSTPNGSTTASSVGYDITLSQASLG